MALPVRLSALAKPHIARLQRYHAELGGDRRVERLDLAIAELLKRVSEFPRAYVVWRGAIRRIISRDFCLAVYYRVYPDHILILGITDQRQDPRRLRLYAPPR